MASDKYNVDGTEGGDKWKTGISEYVKGCVPAVREILRWIERIPEDFLLSPALLNAAVGNTSSAHQQLNLNSAICSFLAIAVSGEANIIFRGAEEMNGFDAWRRIVRYIEHGRPIRLQNLTNDMKAAHQRPINDMGKVVIGIAEFDLKYHEYLEAGGRTIDDFELKQSLTNILPSDLRRELLFKVNLPESYCLFSKAVRESTLTLLQHESRLPIHMIEAAQDHGDGDLGIEDLVGMIAEASGGELFAIHQRFKKKFGTNWRTNKPNNDSRPNNRKDSPTTNTARKTTTLGEKTCA